MFQWFVFVNIFYHLQITIAIAAYLTKIGECQYLAPS